MAKNLRNFPGQAVQDPSSIANLTYNEQSGAQKNAEVGRKLLALPDGASGHTTNATTSKKLPKKGANLAVYNNAGAVGSITLGTNTPTLTSQAPGAVLAGTDGQSVGIACPPNDWTYIACGDLDWVIASAATLLVYLIDDATSIKQEAAR
ncbi:MAG: hypothetical protein HC840_00235 [Leptolyngbyaceae cyanobacterium RM2_2_4]|nr:hypothetical protein [Leptolyngbyaceae cyanobacterium RM2_2_4]